MLIAISYHGRGKTLFPSKGNALFHIERALKKGHFSSFAEKVKSLYPQDPLVVRLQV